MILHPITVQVVGKLLTTADGPLRDLVRQLYYQTKLIDGKYYFQYGDYKLAWEGFSYDVLYGKPYEWAQPPDDYVCHLSYQSNRGDYWVNIGYSDRRTASHIEVRTRDENSVVLAIREGFDRPEFAHLGHTTTEVVASILQGL